jgi:hypothetical protein
LLEYQIDENSGTYHRNSPFGFAGIVGSSALRHSKETIARTPFVVVVWLNL